MNDIHAAASACVTRRYEILTVVNVRSDSDGVIDACLTGVINSDARVILLYATPSVFLMFFHFLTLSSPVVSNGYTSKRSGTLSGRVPECQKIKKGGLDQYAAERFGRLIIPQSEKCVTERVNVQETVWLKNRSLLADLIMWHISTLPTNYRALCWGLFQ